MRCQSEHIYEVRPRKDYRGVNLISDALPFGALWYGEPNAIANAISYAKFYSRSHRAVIACTMKLAPCMRYRTSAAQNIPVSCSMRR